MHLLDFYLDEHQPQSSDSIGEDEHLDGEDDYSGEVIDQSLLGDPVEVLVRWDLLSMCVFHMDYPVPDEVEYPFDEVVHQPRLEEVDHEIETSELDQVEQAEVLVIESLLERVGVVLV
jgi:hypothetical protein